MAHRMAMIWSDVKLDGGKFRATGYGRSFSASLVRGMGFVVEYSSDGRRNLSSINVDSRIPSIIADKLACGILSFGMGLKAHMIELPLRKDASHVMSGLSTALQVLFVGDEAIEALDRSLNHRVHAHRLPGFADILGLCTEWVPLPQSRINIVDNPFPIPVVTMGERPESRVVWRWMLRQQENTLSGQRKRVLQIYDDWEESEPKRFYESYGVAGNQSKDVSVTAYFKGIFDETSLYLKTVFQSNMHLYYISLVHVHIEVNAHSLNQADKNLGGKPKPTRDEIPVPGPEKHFFGQPIFTERAFIYAENVSKVASHMITLNPEISLETYEDAWWMLMLRLQAWTMGVKVVTRDGAKIPSRYYNDPTRMYIL